MNTIHDDVAVICEDINDIVGNNDLEDNDSVIFLESESEHVSIRNVIFYFWKIEDSIKKPLAFISEIGFFH